MAVGIWDENCGCGNRVFGWRQCGGAGCSVVPLHHVERGRLPRSGPVLALHILALRIPFTRMWTNWTTGPCASRGRDSNE
jgi:hypothetical protein